MRGMMGFSVQYQKQGGSNAYPSVGVAQIVEGLNNRRRGGDCDSAETRRYSSGYSKQCRCHEAKGRKKLRPNGKPDVEGCAGDKVSG